MSDSCYILLPVLYLSQYYLSNLSFLFIIIRKFFSKEEEGEVVSYRFYNLKFFDLGSLSFISEKSQGKWQNMGIFMKVENISNLWNMITDMGDTDGIQSNKLLIISCTSNVAKKNLNYLVVSVIVIVTFHHFLPKFWLKPFQTKTHTFKKRVLWRGGYLGGKNWRKN